MQITKTDLLIHSIAMSLGWGLRGTIGGGSVGAMIPGSMIGLCLARVIQLPKRQWAIFTAFCAIGFGIGGQETYGQTIGLLKSSETAAWGMLGLTIKGAVWGLNAALMIWIGLQADRLNPVRKWAGIVILTIFSIVGWKLVNQPKWIYFSDPVHQPREEVWFGLFLGAFLAGLYFAISGKCRNLASFLVCGFLAGACGFGLGSIWLLVGFQLPEPYQKGPWWKLMEFSFGAILGLGFALGSRFLRSPESQEDADPVCEPMPRVWVSIMEGSLAVVVAMVGSYFCPYRLNFSVLVPVMLILISVLPIAGWHLALSFTMIGFFRDVWMDVCKKWEIQPTHWQMIVLILLVVALIDWFVRRPGFRLRSAFLILTWAAFCDYLAQFLLLHPRAVGLVPVVFVLETVMVTALWLRCDHDVNLVLPTD